MGGSVILLSIWALNFFSNIAFAFDPSPMQDICVADLSSSVKVNGYPCMDPAKVEADNFFGGIHSAENKINSTGSAFTYVTADQIPGLNTQGMAIARIDIEVNGFFPPHIHSRATEFVTVLEGSLEVGFVTSYPSYRHYSKVVEKGDVFVFPFGLVHYLRNIGTGNVVTMAVFNSQNPGLTLVPHVIFGANPGIDAGFLSRVLALDKKMVEERHGKF